jgi:hypothetical protein
MNPRTVRRTHVLRCAAGVLAGASFATAYVTHDLEVPFLAAVGVWAFFVGVGVAAVSFIDSSLS